MTVRRDSGRAWDPPWEDGLRRLPSFTQRTAVLLLGVLVATLALLGGVGPRRLARAQDAGGR